MIRQPAEYVGEPGARIDVIELAGLDQRVDGSGALAATVGAGKGPVVTADGDAAQGSFGRIVGQANAAIIEEAGQGRPEFEAVLDGLGDRVFRGEFGALLAQPGSEVFNFLLAWLQHAASMTGAGLRA